MKRHTFDSAVQCLARNGAKVGAITVTTTKPTGLKQLSAIDHLVHYHNFRWTRETKKQTKQQEEK